MANYLVVTIQNKESISMAGYDTINDALALYHTELAYRHEDRFHTYVTIYDEATLMELRSDYYDKSIDDRELPGAKYVVTVNQNDETLTPFVYNTENEARAKFHEELAYRADARTLTIASVMNKRLNVIAEESYVKEVVPPNNEE